MSLKISTLKISNEKRKKSIIMSGKECGFGSKSIFNCHCNDCHNHIIEYLGKKKGKVYFYDGDFAKIYIQDKKVKILSFCTDEDEETNTCECFIKLLGGTGGQCEWIPRREIMNNLKEVFKVKRDVRKEITALSSDIGSVVSKVDGTLQVCYYENKESVKDIVTRYLGKKSLLECFVKIDFIECPKPEVAQCDLSQKDKKEARRSSQS